MTDYSVKRSYRGNVLVAPPDAEPVTGEWRMSKDGKRYFWTDRKDVEQYGRTSKAGEHLKGSGEGLAKHKAAMAAIGTVMSDTARSKISTLINQYDGDPYYRGDDGGSESGKDRLLKAVELACEVAGSSSAASLGTEFHQLWDLVNKGVTPRLIQPHLVEPLRRYRDAVKQIKFLDGEMLVVNDDLKRAGSADHLMQLPAGLTTPDGITHDKPLVVIGDGKTGRWEAEYPASVTAQLAGYGLGFKYDQETNTREPLHPDMNTRWGVLVHYPLTVKNATVAFYWIDLEVGLRAAKVNNMLDNMMAFFKSVKGKPVRFDIQ